MEVNNPKIRVQSSQEIKVVNPDAEYIALHEEFESYKKSVELERLENELAIQRTNIAHNLEKSSIRQELGEQIEEANERYNALDASFNEYVTDAEAEEARLNDRIAELIAEIESLNGSISEKDITLQSLANQVSDLQSYSQAADSSLAAKVNELEALRQSTVSLSNYDDLQSRFNNLTLTYNNLQLEYTQYRSNSVSRELYNVAVDTSYGVPQTTYNTLQSNYNTLQNNYNSMQQEFLSLTDRMTEALAAARTANDNYAELLSRYNTMKTDYDNITTESVSKQSYDALQTRYDALDASFADYKAGNNIVPRSDYDTVVESKNQALSTASQLQTELNALMANYELLQSQYDALDASCVSRIDYNQLQTRYQDLEDNAASLLAQYNTANATLSDLRAQLAAMTSNYEAANQSLTTLTADYNQYIANSVSKQTYDALVSRVGDTTVSSTDYNTLNGRYQTAVADLAALQASYDTLNSTYTTVQNNLNTLQYNYNNALLLLEQANIDVSTFQGSTVSMSSYEALQARIAELTAVGSNIEQVNTLYTTLQGRYAELQATYNQLVVAHEACEDPDLADHYAEALAQVESLTASNTTLTANNTTLTSQVETLTNTVNSLNTQLSSLQYNYRNLQNSTVEEDLYYQLNDQYTELQSLYSTVSNERTRLANDASTLESQVSRLTAQIAEMTENGQDPSTYAELLTQYNVLERDYNRVIADASTANENYTAIAARLTAAQEEIAAIRDSSVSVSDYETLQSNYNMLTGQYDQLNSVYQAILIDIETQDTVARSLHTQLQQQYAEALQRLDASTYNDYNTVVAKSSYDALLSLYNSAINDCASTNNGTIARELYDAIDASYNYMLLNGHVVNGKTVAQSTYNALLADNTALNTSYITARDNLLNLRIQFDNYRANSVDENMYTSLLNQYSTLQTSYSGLQDQYTDLNGRYNASSINMIDPSVYNDLVGTYDRLRVDYINLQTQYNVQAASLEGINKTLDHMNDLFDSSAERGTVSDGSYGLLYDQFELYKSLYTVPKSQYDTLITMYTEANNNYLSVSAQYSDLSERYDALDASYDRLDASYQAIAGIETVTKTQYDALDASYKSLQNNIATNYVLKSVYDDYVTMCRENHISNTQYNQLIDDISNNNMVALSVYNDLYSQYTTLDASYDALDASYTALDSSYQALDASYQALDASYDALVEADGTSTAAYQELDSSYQNLLNDYSILDASYNALDASYDAYAQSHTHTNSEYNTLQGQYDAKVADCLSNHIDTSVYNAYVNDHLYSNTDYTTLDSSFSTYRNGHSYTDASYNALNDSYIALDASYDALDASYYALNYRVDNEFSEYIGLGGSIKDIYDTTYAVVGFVDTIYSDSSIIGTKLKNIDGDKICYTRSQSGALPSIRYSTNGAGLIKEFILPKAITGGSVEISDCSYLEKLICDEYHPGNSSDGLSGILYDRKNLYPFDLTINNCTKLQAIITNRFQPSYSYYAVVPTNLTSYSFTNNTSLQIAYVSELNIGEIPENAFTGCTNLLDVEVEPNITSIGDNAFKDTKLRSLTMKTYGNTQTSVNILSNRVLTIPNTVTSIGHNAFVNFAQHPQFTIDVSLPSTCEYYSDSFDSSYCIITGGTLIS